MANSAKPSKDWKEAIGADEASRHAGYAERFAQIQAKKSQRWGKGRALHRKQLCAAHGTLQVLDGLPDFARQGLFAQAQTFRVNVRLSNGGLDRAPDKAPDIRGLGLRVLGVQGDSALGNGPAVSQDFTLINQEAFAFPNSIDFMGLVGAAADGKGALLRYFFMRYGVFGMVGQLGKLAKSAGKPFSGFATEPLFSAVPIANGPYAVRVRLLPADSNGQPDATAGQDLGTEFSARLARQPLQWDLQLQFFSNEPSTPIETADVVWPTPYTTVARLSLPKQDTNSPEGQALAQQIESGVIDPWQALAAHRPLGEVQRARKVVYFTSQQGRGAV